MSAYSEVDSDAFDDEEANTSAPPPTSAPASTRPPSTARPPAVPPASATQPLLTSEPRKRAKLDCACVMWSIVWMVVLVVFAWPLSVAMAALYGFVSPLISLIGIEDISDSMLQGVHVGRECARNVRTGTPMI